MKSEKLNELKENAIKDLMDKTGCSIKDILLIESAQDPFRFNVIVSPGFVKPKWPNLRKLVAAKTPLKFRIKDEQQSKELQEFLFDFGMDWAGNRFSGDKIIDSAKKPFLFCSLVYGYSIRHGSDEYLFVISPVKEYDLENDCLVGEVKANEWLKNSYEPGAKKMGLKLHVEESKSICDNCHLLIEEQTGILLSCPPQPKIEKRCPFGYCGKKKECRYFSDKSVPYPDCGTLYTTAAVEEMCNAADTTLSAVEENTDKDALDEIYNRLDFVRDKLSGIMSDVYTLKMKL